MDRVGVGIACWMSAAAVPVACGGDGESRTGTAGLGSATMTAGSGGAASSGNEDTDSSSSGASADDSTGATDPTAETLDPTESDSTGETPVAMDCTYLSTSFGGPMQELDVMGDPSSPFRLTFTVPDLPAPDSISSAELRFRSYDADHPGEEGLIYVNDGPGLDMPANAAWDNAESTGIVDVTSHVVEGNNTIEFGPGPLDRSFFRIGDVELRVNATVDACTPPDDTDDSAGGMGVQQEQHYSEATYTGRNNWVWRCQPGFDYAFTAASDEHIPTDCESLYAPDGSAHGTATFTFEDVIEDDYLVEVHAYHTWNRNPNGARVIVDGVEGFVQQRTSEEGESSFETAQWGIAHLEGTVDIVLDSSQGGYASDAVSWIRITPQ